MQWSEKMARAIPSFQTKDGGVFVNKHDANRHERKLLLLETIDGMDISAPAKNYLKENWKEVKNMAKRFQSVDLEQDDEAEPIGVKKRKTN